MIRVRFIVDWKMFVAGEFAIMKAGLARHLEGKEILIRIADLSIPERH